MPKGVFLSPSIHQSFRRRIDCASTHLRTSRILEKYWSFVVVVEIRKVRSRLERYFEGRLERRRLGRPVRCAQRHFSILQKSRPRCRVCQSRPFADWRFHSRDHPPAVVATVQSDAETRRSELGVERLQISTRSVVVWRTVAFDQVGCIEDIEKDVDSTQFKVRLSRESQKRRSSSCQRSNETENALFYRDGSFRHKIRRLEIARDIRDVLLRIVEGAVVFFGTRLYQPGVVSEAAAWSEHRVTPQLDFSLEKETRIFQVSLSHCPSASGIFPRIDESQAVARIRRGVFDDPPPVWLVLEEPLSKILGRFERVRLERRKQLRKLALVLQNCSPACVVVHFGTSASRSQRYQRRVEPYHVRFTCRRDSSKLQPRQYVVDARLLPIRNEKSHRAVNSASG